MSELYSSIGCMDVNLSFDAHKITKSAPGFSIPMTLAPSRTLNLAKTFAQSSVLSVTSCYVFYQLLFGLTTAHNL